MRNFIAPRALVGLAFLIHTSGCENEIDRATPAKVGEAKPAPTSKAAGPGSEAEKGTLELDAAASRVGFVGAKVTGSEAGSFAGLTGKAVLDGDVPSSIEVTVEIGSVQIEPGGLRNHLASDDFFAAKTHPTAHFSSTRITPTPDAGQTHEVAGNLQLRGVTKEIVFPARITIDDESARGTAEFKIDRKDFGIAYAGAPDDLIQDQVLLKLDLSFPRG